VVRIGEGGGEHEVSIRKVVSKIQRMKPVLTKQEVSAVNKRLKAMGGLRTPLPAGGAPNRARLDRKAMSGRQPSWQTQDRTPRTAHPVYSQTSAQRRTRSVPGILSW